MKTEQQKIIRVLSRLRKISPSTPSQLSAYLRAYLGISFPRKKICPHHDAPFDYLAYSFLADHSQNRDVIVWANRGGGKTQLGAAATFLDCIFKPRCEVRILGGSEQQAQQMYSYFRGMIDNGYDDFLAGKVTARQSRFKNDSIAQVLTQSQSSVRGNHVQRLRCDEVELFDPDIWQAAQYVTQSKHNIPARLEALSTMHMPFGLMSQLVNDADSSKVKVFRWCLMEVLEKCSGRECSQCYLYEDCKGRAKEADGYFSIDDAIAQKRRSSRKSWEAEMLCLRPSAEDLVFSDFEERLNVKQIGYDHNAESYRAIDFGYSNPLACLFIQVRNGCVYVLDEHIQARTTLAEHSRIIRDKWPYTFNGNFCDPAGRQRNDITGTSPVTELAGVGINCTSRASRISDGIEIIRDYILSGDNTVRLFIDPKCRGLIKAMMSLRYKKSLGVVSELPHKDGVHDHVIDALRYFFINRFGKSSDCCGRGY